MSALVAFVVLMVFGLFPPGHQSGSDAAESIEVHGRSRTYLVHRPVNRSAERRIPLVIVLHGGGGSGERMVTLTRGGFDRLADRDTVIVVYPDGIEKNWNDGRTGEESGARAHREQIDDVGFIAALIDRFVAKENVDAGRVYATGMSNGAIMCYRLACELSTRIAAIAPVDGSIAEHLLPTCSPQGPVSILAINNVNDPLVHWEGGEITGPFGWRKRGKVLPVEESIRYWRTIDRCADVPVITTLPDADPGDGTVVTRKVYGRGSHGAEVVLYQIDGGGHTWPGGRQYLPAWIIGKTSRDFDANEAIWTFFQHHHLPKR